MDRRVYVGSLHYELTEEDIKVPFSHFGVVVKVDMPRDPGQMRSKGFCFIEYEKPESAQMAMMAMNGFLLAGRQIKVGRATGSGETQTYGLDARALASLGAANAASMQAQAQQMAQNAAMALANGGMGGGGGGMNMNGQPMQSPYHQHNNMNNNNNMMMNTNNNNNNPSPPVMSSIPNPSALAAQAAQAAAAAAAAQSAAQKRIYVGNIHYEISETQLRPIFEAFGPITGIQMMMNTDGSNKHKGFCFITFEHDKSAKMAIDAMNGFELAGRPIKVNWATATAAAGVSSTSPAPIINNINIPSPSSILPSSVPTPQLPVSLTREENVRISSQSQRQQLMAKLAHTESPVILLKNMVTADDVDGDLEGEIREECEKSGPVIKVFIYTDPNSSKVNIYVHFAHVNAASQARLALDQRYFGGNIVQANFYPLTKFEAGIFQDE